MKTTLHNPSKNQPGLRTVFTRSLLLLAFGLFALAAKPGSVPNGSASASAESKKTIKAYFKFPQILVTREEVKTATLHTVEVLFTTNENGKVNFALAKTTDVDLKREVEKQFYKLCLPKLKQDVVHSVVLRFKTL